MKKSERVSVNTLDYPWNFERKCPLKIFRHPFRKLEKAWKRVFMGTLIFKGIQRLEGTIYIQAIPGVSYPLVILQYVCEVKNEGISNKYGRA